MAHIGIVGGGIIGCATALHLLDRGHQVTLVERDAGGLPASVGNAGILAIPEIDPIARPGMLLSAPRWLLDPLGPLALRWGDVPALLPWLLRLLAASRLAQVERSRQALTFLMKTAAADHAAMARMIAITGHLRQTGALAIFDTEAARDKAFAHEVENARILGGFEVEKLDAAETRRRVPALAGAFAGAIYNAGYQTFEYPLTFLRRLQAAIRERASFIDAAAASLAWSNEGISVRTEAQNTHLFDKVVVSAGVWSKPLVEHLGLHVQLETERGYNTTFVNPSVTLEMPVFFSEHGFVATPFENMLRVGGAVELARPETAANYARASAMRKKMRRYVPDLPDEGGTEWMGRRPSTPDSVPVIGLHPGDPRIAFAFGHGHLGLTLAATTGRHVADLLAGGADPELDAFSIRRFQ
ncbi:FAD-binding oxidoreductase [Rhizobium sp. TRM96647]|uniref:NAD(P)/FAD-dependent oxidoreductase n=1 Tax=unclassified Rhizobium TaxID=2613769 RepID=UPI0021E73752|nr:MULTISPECIES: FAD-binding oxidoreductase [unclassified Rhizobium]MCV3736044.1 FAD-binding oxidoreductase [Rhizobium sp. TRM96647]MCV3758294.1 FAD-binding oxidoreductase [Rhizobium sp. TRM96650]